MLTNKLLDFTLGGFVSMTEIICGDCGCGEGELHELFCSKERCPFCEQQLVSCGCISTVLSLDQNEQRAVEDYEDDSVEPLKSINRRWERALIKKGRVPF